jgi:RNA polymerase sigma-70 factor (ECF subfamily)
MRSPARHGGARFTGDGRVDDHRSVPLAVSGFGAAALIADSGTPQPGIEADSAEAEAADAADVVAADEPTPGGESWALVEAAQHGNAAAFGELYDKYADMVHRYVLHRLGDRAVAEDLTSETFLRGFRRIGSISYQGRDVGAWFVTIARNLVLDHLKSSRFRLEVSTADPDDVRRVQSGPEAAVLTRATTDELLRAVAQLGNDQRDCVVLRFLHGLSVAETAAAMNRTEGAIKALQHRAVRRLAQLLPAGFRQQP